MLRESRISNFWDTFCATTIGRLFWTGKSKMSPCQVSKTNRIDHCSFFQSFLVQEVVGIDVEREGRICDFWDTFCATTGGRLFCTGKSKMSPCQVSKTNRIHYCSFCWSLLLQKVVGTDAKKAEFVFPGAHFARRQSVDYCGPQRAKCCLAKSAKQMVAISQTLLRLIAARFGVIFSCRRWSEQMAKKRIRIS